MRPVPLLALVAGCRVIGGGLPDGGWPPDDGPTDRAADTTDLRRDQRPDLPPAERGPEPMTLIGSPELLGCADGTREGFADLDSWPKIAGCAGAWSIPGLLGNLADNPQCDRRAGDTSTNPGGDGCSIADLCFEGWHVCRDPSDVESHSPSECESIGPVDYPRLFIVRAGASPQGLCTTDPRNANDLHGCGSLGQPETASCQPLDRRMGFADCLGTGGVWSCGTADDSLREAALVTKTDGALGGVLCCRNP